MAYISNSEMLLEWAFPKKKFPFQAIISKKENLMADISNSKMILAKITKKGNYMLEISEKYQKNPKKY